MKTHEKVATIMTKEVVTVDIEKSLKEAKELFHLHGIRHLPVVSGNRLLGILSLTDILRISFGNIFDNLTDEDEAIFEMLSINQIMKHSPETVNADDTIAHAAQILTAREFHALPVVSGGKLVGIITTTDIIRYFLKE